MAMKPLSRRDRNERANREHVLGNGPMKLVDYLGLFRQWPPAAHNPAGEPVQLEHGLDTLVLAFTEPTGKPGRVRIRILTVFEGSLSMREIVDTEAVFARVLCDFLNKHRGRAIREIGEMDVEFLV
jgi:hypothetical protein